MLENLIDINFFKFKNYTVLRSERSVFNLNGIITDQFKTL